MPATSMVEHDHRIRAARPARRARAAATQSPAAASIRISPRRSHAMPLFRHRTALLLLSLLLACPAVLAADSTPRAQVAGVAQRSEEHTSELQSLMRISYAVFCLKKKTHTDTKDTNNYTHDHNHYSDIITGT